mgnify:CR=1 FL=1
MSSDLRRITAGITARFKRRAYGRTFNCPVCHFEIAIVDVGENRLIVCPVCGVVIDVEEVYGHAVPVVLEVELFRPQPKARIHPLATHVPIGLYPFAVLGALLLVAASAWAAEGEAGLRAALDELRAQASRLIDAGVRVIVQPGGSKRDAETLALCDARGVTCLLTGMRHFRH